jgi:hypothetical protein
VVLGIYKLETMPGRRAAIQHLVLLLHSAADTVQGVLLQGQPLTQAPAAVVAELTQIMEQRNRDMDQYLVPPLRLAQAPLVKEMQGD